MRSLSPWPRVVGPEMRAPLTKVPLVEPRSSAFSSVPSSESDACRREASGSSITSPALASRPITTAPDTSNSLPSFGPCTITMEMSATAATLCTGLGGSQGRSEFRVDPVHHRAQFPALALDLRVLLLLAHALEV